MADTGKQYVRLSGHIDGSIVRGLYTRGLGATDD